MRTNENGSSDGGAPFHFALVGEDGTAQPLDLTLGEVAPGIDPDQPYLAYAEMVDQLVQVIVVDVTTEEIVATVGVPDAASWEGFEVPPVALSGDTVYVGGKKTWAVDWRTGEVRVAEQLGGGFPDVHGGHTVTSDAEGTQVVDVETGETVLDADDNSFATLSPDGRAAVVSDLMAGTAQLGPLDGHPSTEAPPSEQWLRLDPRRQAVRPDGLHRPGLRALGRMHRDEGRPARTGRRRVLPDGRVRLPELIGDGPGRISATPVENAHPAASRGSKHHS